MKLLLFTSVLVVLIGIGVLVIALVAARRRGGRDDDQPPYAR